MWSASGVGVLFVKSVRNIRKCVLDSVTMISGLAEVKLKMYLTISKAV